MASLSWPYPLPAQSIVVDHHDVGAFDTIPEAYKIAAANTPMLFMDRSVGYNISTFLDCLSSPWADAPSYCKRHEHMDAAYAVDPSEVYWQGAWDRTNWHFAFWPENCSEDVNCFIDYVDDRIDSFEVLGCQFSYLAVLPGSKIADTLTGFFGSEGSDNKASTYAAFAADHPDKKIIWWTTSLARGIGTPESEAFNQQMRQYAAENDIILFDVADILSHAPDGTPCFDNRDGIAYKDENHPDDGLSIPAICPQYTTETEGGHLGAISAGGVRVAKAFWVLMARIAGWEGQTTSVAVAKTNALKIFPNPSDGHLFISLNPTGGVDLFEIIIFDITGKQLVKTQMIHHKGGGYKISTESLSSGLYIVMVKNGQDVHAEWMLIK